MTKRVTVCIVIECVTTYKEREIGWAKSICHYIFGVFCEASVFCTIGMHVVSRHLRRGEPLSERVQLEAL